MHMRKRNLDYYAAIRGSIYPVANPAAGPRVFREIAPAEFGPGHTEPVPGEEEGV